MIHSNFDGLRNGKRGSSLFEKTGKRTESNDSFLILFPHFVVAFSLFPLLPSVSTQLLLSLHVIAHTSCAAFYLYVIVRFEYETGNMYWN